ncbi:MAG: phytanoyl-CoA dioxygenase family protein [Pseudomonadales bacterium]
MKAFDTYHQSILPSANRRAEAAQALGNARSLAFQLPCGTAYSYASDGDLVTISSGSDDAKVVANISEQAFDAYVSQQFSLTGLFYTNQLTLSRGEIAWLLQWEPALQALYFDRPIWSAANIADVSELNINRRFDYSEVQSSAAEMQAFLRTTGYLHIQNVFNAAEIEAFASDIEQQKAKASADDGRSWWAKKSDGEEVCCRVTYLQRSSELFAKLPEDPRLQKIAALLGESLRPVGKRMDGVSVVIKNSDVVEGMSDLPWHRDCGMGGHHLICPSLNIGIQLDESSAENGQLKFLAGSANHANPPVDESIPDLPVAALNAKAGDVSVHLAHVMHIAPPPLGDNGNRRVLYTSFVKQELIDAIPEGQSYNDVLFRQGDGRVRTPQERAAES